MNAKDHRVIAVQWNVRHFLCLLLAAIFMVVGQPSLACTPNTCHVIPECASVHCTCCCGSMNNCRMPCKSSGKSEQSKRDNSKSFTCPLLTAATPPVATPSVHVASPLVLAFNIYLPILGNATTQHRVVALIQSTPPPPAPTLLSLGCLLTV